MFDKELEELRQISRAAGATADYVQGGGGNTSVKLNDSLMAVKASGFKLTQITPKEAFVVVNYSDIKKYYNNVDLKSGIDYEKDSVEFAKKSIVEMEGIKTLRPSVEAGFHSILKKYVIHTHPVYANILCCSEEGEALAGKIAGPKGYSWLWIPYINPGFSLTLSIKKGIEKNISEGKGFPEVIFMENHGLVVTSDDSAACIRLHEEINGLIKEYFGIREAYPAIALEKTAEGDWLSKTEFLKKFFKGSGIKTEFFSEAALYPDQLVYLCGNISVGGSDSKLNINTKTGELVYKTSYEEALTMEETLLSFIYVISKVRESGLKLKTMTAEGASFINNWESEKYRKGLVK